MPIYHIWIFLCLSTFKLLMKSLHFKKCMFKSSPNIPNQNYSKKPNPPSLISQNPCWKINSRQKYSISKKMSKSIFALLQTQIYLIGRSRLNPRRARFGSVFVKTETEMIGFGIDEWWLPKLFGSVFDQNQYWLVKIYQSI